jgi:hypothetical protein
LIMNQLDLALIEHITECKGEYLKNKLTIQLWIWRKTG